MRHTPLSSAFLILLRALESAFLQVPVELVDLRIGELEQQARGLRRRLRDNRLAETLNLRLDALVRWRDRLAKRSAP